MIEVPLKARRHSDLLLVSPTVIGIRLYRVYNKGGFIKASLDISSKVLNSQKMT
jgi:hypothetical protein